MSGILVAPTFQLARLRDVNDAAKADQYGLVWDSGTSKHIYVDIVVPADLSSYLSTADIDTLAELNAIVGDDTIIGAAATDASSFGFVVDEDNMASDLATKIPTQQSVKAYVDAVVAGLTFLATEDIDTLAEINAILGDATLVTVEATDASGYGWVLDEDDLASDSATKVPTQQSVKAYVDAEIAGVGGGGGDTLPVVDTTGIAKGSTDATKIVRLEVDGLTTGTTRVLTVQDADGTIAFLSDITSGGGLTVTAKTAGYTAANGDLVVCDATGGSFNVTMPAAPTLDDRIGIYLEHGSASLVVTVQGNGKVLAEFGSAVALQTPGDVVVFQYDGAKWVIAANGIQTFSLTALTAATVDEAADFVRLHDGDATEDFEKRVTVKEMLAPYIEDSTLGTAAGDIVYRPTANDHWANLPKGSDGEVLTLASGLPSWAAASGGLFPIPTRTAINIWQTAPTIGKRTASATLSLVAGRIYTCPIIIQRTATANRINVQITSTSATSIRLGIYEELSGAPGDLLLDAGTVSAASTGNKAITISQELTPGIYFLCLLAEGTPGVDAIEESDLLIHYGSGTPESDDLLTQMYGAQSYGALLSTFPTPSMTNQNMPKISLRF
jgi:hypothetical protein